jgi:beta-galactosidase
LNQPLRYPPINPRCPHMLHGADYNPDQWLHDPKVLDEDVRLMKLAGCNVMSVGIFAWAALEPSEGQYTFDWLDDVMDRLVNAGIHVNLATPSGARPAWMSQQHPDVLRTLPDRRKALHGKRHNHCPTSPLYRRKCHEINSRLAQRYAGHPALVLWHVSNEYGGECHCELCRDAFRKWVRDRYDNDLDKLNAAWWTSFWAHTYSDWSQIEPPSPIGEQSVHALVIDWKRFVSDQTIDFMRAEIAPLREHTPDIPVTTNYMSLLRHDLDYWKMAEHLDVMSYDGYPSYHSRAEDVASAQAYSFGLDLMRSFKRRPFILMESSPSSANWQSVNKLKRPGVHRLESLQAVAHGSDTVQYFQWRQSRGAYEKFHGSVISHAGHEHTRVFADVREVGDVLAHLDDVRGTCVRPRTAVLYDTENRWAIEAACGPRRLGREYAGTCVSHYKPFWQAGVAVDIINADAAFDDYKLVIAPMLYMLKPGVAERLERFVNDGGVLVTTYLSGIADATDLCFLGGWPGPLRRLLGIWIEETDVLNDDEHNTVVAAPDNEAGLNGEYQARIFCDLLHAESAHVLATFGQDFYAGRPAVTVNRFGKGRAYHIASRNDDRFHSDLCGHLIRELGLERALDVDLPHGVTAQLRTDGRRRFVFLLNFTPEAQTIALGTVCCRDLLSAEGRTGELRLAPHGSHVLEIL